MTSTTLLSLSALLLALCGAASASEPAPPATAAPAIALEKYTLPNGLDVILVENHKLPLTAVNLWYHVGPANEAAGLTGFAHLFEHMMFAATKHVPRGLADRLLEGAGATDSNGSTDFDRTNYFDTVPSNQLELALWIHADRMGYLLDVLDQRALANQQDVVRNERRQSVENRPYGIVEEALYHQLFPKTHPYYANVIGSHADIQAARLTDVRDFFTRYYGPDNASLVIVGDIDKARVKALVARYFGSFRRAAARPNTAPVVTPPITAERRAVVADRVELPRVFMGWLTTPAYRPGDAELTLLAHILGGGKSSRLYKALVYQRQIAQDVGASQNSNALSSVFTLDATARPGHDAREIEAAIDAELRALRADGPTEQELEQARNTVETMLLGQIEKVGGLANQLNQYNQYLGNPDYLATDLERLRRVTLADIRRVLAAQLGQDARAVVYGVPGAPALDPEVPVPAPGKFKAVAAKPINPDQSWRRRVPAAGPAPDRLALPLPDTFTLANGLTVLHHHNPALPLVAAELVVKSGSDANPVEQPGLASFTAQMLDQGTASRDATQIADQAARLGATLGAGSSADASTLAVSALRANFGAALALLADVALHPTFPAAEVERQRASRAGDLAQRRESATAVAATVEAAALYGARHPYGFDQLGTAAALGATSRADLLGFWQGHYVPNNAALVVSGDLTTSELKQLAETHFGAWRPAPVAPATAGPTSTTRARVVLVDKPGAPQTALRLSSIGPARATPDYAALQVMNGALGGMFSSRLNNNLREEKGYTYGVHSGFRYRRLPGPFAIAASVRTDVTGPAVSEMLREVDRMSARPMTKAELSNARDAQVLSLPGQFETNLGIGASLANIYVYDLGPDYYATLAPRLAGVTAGQVQAVAGRYLRPERLIVIGVGDTAHIAPQLEQLKLGPLEYRDADGDPR
jgi:zinc protease